MREAPGTDLINLLMSVRGCARLSRISDGVRRTGGHAGRLPVCGCIAGEHPTRVPPRSTSSAETSRSLSGPAPTASRRRHSVTSRAEISSSPTIFSSGRELRSLASRSRTRQSPRRRPRLGPPDTTTRRAHTQPAPLTSRPPPRSQIAIVMPGRGPEPMPRGHCGMPSDARPPGSPGRCHMP